MKLLITSAFYPTPDGKRPLYYVHSRNLYYKKSGIDVTVLNFDVLIGYEFDGIRVISLEEYSKSNEKYDILICHAANLRNHYRFIKKYGCKFKKKVFVFHGHEILHFSEYYPKPYLYLKRSRFKEIFQNLYDDVKIGIWRKYYLSNIKNIRLVFVSNWIYKQFLLEMSCNEEDLCGNAVVISNSIGKFFEEHSYTPTDYKYDFITIRSNLDGSKYGIDIVVKLAIKNPEYRFCILGKGKYFDYMEKPENIELISGEFSHDDIANYLNRSKIALLPTREDTQGLMACELAAYGIPLITSNIDVCKEVFADCPNVALISNDNPDLNSAVQSLNVSSINEKWDTYFAKNTIYKEIEYLNSYFIN